MCLTEMGVRYLHPGFRRGLFKESLLKDASGIGAEEYIIGKHSAGLGNVGAADVTAMRAQRAPVFRQEDCLLVPAHPPQPSWIKFVATKTPLPHPTFLTRRKCNT